MSTIENQTSRAAYIILGIGLICIAISQSGCGQSFLVGPPGPQGEPGPTGSQGAQGVSGSQGAQGAAGQNGYSVVMKTEAASSQCATGNGSLLTFAQDMNYSGQYANSDPVLNTVLVCDGAQGAQGATGANGHDGQSSTASLASASVTDCPNGGVKLTVQNGDLSDVTNICNGAPGATGSQGVQGPAGTNTTSVSMIQLCSNYATSYPSIFPEFAECVSDQLYAVYWDSKNSWLSEIPPGQYISTSTSAPCNFTVGANCSVTRN